MMTTQTLIALLFLGAALSGVAEAVCKGLDMKNFQKDVTMGDKCYAMSTKELTWRAASRLCRRQNGTLVMPKDASTRTALVQYIQQDENMKVWIGVQLESVEDFGFNFKWIDEEPFTLTNSDPLIGGAEFEQRLKKYKKGNRECVAVTAKLSPKFMLFNCEKKTLHGVCEFDISEDGDE